MNERPRIVKVALIVMGLMLVVRLAPGWNDLPVFGDEGIYLRWAQVIRENPLDSAHLWVSLADPKPPLHFWLLALVWNWAKDPLTAGRLLSVAAAVLTVPAIMALCVELNGVFPARGGSGDDEEAAEGTKEGRGPGPLTFALMAGVLLVFCPYLAFYQRMALAESLFVLEAVTAAWLSLRLAREGVSLGRGLWSLALPLGLVLGAAMLTRQVVSYVLWELPVAAAVAGAWGNGRRPDGDDVVVDAGKRLGWLVAAVVVAGVCWSPFLIVKNDDAPLKTRILYQPQFNKPMSLGERAALAGGNFVQMFLPVERGEKGGGGNSFHMDRGWYWLYLTPVVEVLGVAGAVGLIVRRRWGVVGFLALWLAITLGPLILLGTVGWSRYALGGVAPFLVLAGYALAEVMTGVVRWRENRIGWALAGLAMAVLLAWPVASTARQSSDWLHQTMVPADERQYLTGWPSGTATMAAVRLLKALPADEPLTVITTDAWGNPSDGIWVYLKDRPHTRLFYVDWFAREPVLRPPPGGSETNTYWLRDDKWLFTPARAVTLPAGSPVLFVMADPIYGNFPGGEVSAEALMRKYDPGARLVLRAANPVLRGGAGTYVAVYQLRE